MRALDLQTVERESLFTKLDFRTKLFAMFVLTFVAFIWESFVLSGALALVVVLICLAAGVKFSYIRTVVTLLLPFYAMIIITQGFFAGPLITSRTQQTTLTPLFTLPIHWGEGLGDAVFSVEGVQYGLNVSFKMLTLVLSVPLVVLTTNINTMIVSLVRAGVPYQFAFIFSSTLRFFPLLFEEAQAILEAQRLRGLPLESWGPLKRLRVYAKIAIPLILAALVKSQTLEVVLQSKAFSGSPQRTYLHESKLGAMDYVIMVFLSTCLILVLLAYALLDVGRLSGPI